MNHQLKFLVDLQRLDKRIAALREEKARVPQEIAELEREFKGRQERLEAARSRLEAHAREQRDKEGEIKAQEARLSSSRGKLTAVKTNKEYQAMLSEIETIKGKVDRLEEELLRGMETAESLREDLAQEEGKLEGQRARFEARRRELEVEMGRLNRELSQEETERRNLISFLEQRWLKAYQDIREVRKGLAVVAIRERVCTGCNMSETLQRFAEIREGSEIFTCQNCGRILYWEGEAPAVEAGL